MSHHLKSLLIFIFIILSNQTLYGKDNDSKVLVVGGTGRIGSQIVKLLSENQFDVTVMSRSTTSKRSVNELPIHYVTGDVLIEDQVADVFRNQNYDVVINAIAKVGEDKNPHAIGQRNLNKWSKKTGVRHFILIGSVGAGNKQSHLVTDRAWSMWKDILQQKGIAEQSLMNSGINFTVIRTGIIIYDDTPATGNAILSNDHNIVGLITRKDLAILAVDCIMKSKCINKVFHALDESLIEIHEN
ncbi:MAG: hypothetical protein CMD97_02630 [Gammaproteobacteria bacterium]|nr:hypothetical protein [Gammaproteobacteria bacterium]|tara:strand:- start:2347 stop:3075 length:729 start_codon:yes stop_codon:yes gene_type:complete